MVIVAPVVCGSAVLNCSIFRPEGDTILDASFIIMESKTTSPHEVIERINKINYQQLLLRYCIIMHRVNNKLAI